MKTNLPISYPQPLTHEGAAAARITPLQELRRTVMTCMLWEPTFYESGESQAARIVELCKQVTPNDICRVAIEARQKMYLRHVPLFLLVQLAKRCKTEPRVKGGYSVGTFLQEGVLACVQRADELAELLAMYWWDQPGAPLAAGLKRGLRKAFQKFSSYSLAKYDRRGAVKLRDVMFLTHPIPYNDDQVGAFKGLANGTLAAPDTWEVELSAGKDKRETFTRLLQERKLGGLAVLRNLRNMIDAGVSKELIVNRLKEGPFKKVLPFQFVTAAKHAPLLESYIEAAMYQGITDLPVLKGSTVLLVDVSGSMDNNLSSRSQTSRIDAATGLAILLREKAEDGAIMTFSNTLVSVPPRRGFALRDAIAASQPHAGTALGGALAKLQASPPPWGKIDRLIVITDEQTNSLIPPAWISKSYVINVAGYKNGVGYHQGWTHIDGWSEHVIDYIRMMEEEDGREDVSQD